MDKAREQPQIRLPYSTSVAINDQHIPFQDRQANALVFAFIKDFKPNYIDILGDLIDFWQISKFLRDPSRRGSIQSDIDIATEYLQELRDLAPNAKITLHFGNHMFRFKKYIWANAWQLDSLRSLDLKWMLECEKVKIRVVEEEDGYEIRGKLVLTHGTVVSQDSGMTARRNLNKYGMSVMCGHTHRLGSTYKTDLRGTIGAWENGCLCNLSLIKQWGNELANWQQGFSVIHFRDDHERFQVQQMPIIKNKILFGEHEFTI